MPQSSKSAKDIFLQALDAAPSDRAALLDAACGPDSALRCQVEALLKVHDEPDSFLDRSRINVGISDEIPAAISPTVNESIIEQPGSQLGPYKLLQQVGEGGMGSVWMAEQHEPVRRRVALKLIKPGMDSRQVLARFEAERQALSMMDHPNIAKVLDAGTTEGGRPYFVMELVKGQPITQYCDERHLTPRERLELFLPLCHAIQHAHQKGIIHRDIKPSNVLVAEYDGRPVAKVIDFGVAKAVHQPLTEKTMFTGIGQIIGTLEYMSPEQARVNQLDIDTRSDVYSLGVLLYELLTGSTPFDKKRMREAALDELLRIIREEEPPRPSTKLSSSETMPSIAANRKTEPARLSTLVRGELDWIVMKALEKDRNRRYETANGFAMDVERYLNDEAVLACPPSARYRFRKFARRNKALLEAATAVAAALVIGLIGTAWQAIRATRAEERAVANEQRALENERQAIAERDEKETARREAIASAEREAEQRRLAEAAATAERSAKEAEASQRAAAETAEKRAVEEAAIARAVTDFLREDLLALAGAEKQFEAELIPDPDVKLSTLLDRALFKVEERFTEQPRVRGAVMCTLALALRSIGRATEAAELLEKVLKYCTQVLGPEHPDTLCVMNALGATYADNGKYDNALALAERTFELRKARLGPEHPDTLGSMNNLALCYGSAGEYEKALALQEKTLALTKAKFGSEHPDTITSMIVLASAYSDAGKYDAAMTLHEQTFKVAKATLGLMHPECDSIMNNLGVAYLNAGEYHKAVMIIEQLLERRKGQLGHDHPRTLTAMSNLAVAYGHVGKLDKALVLQEQTLELAKSIRGLEHPETLTKMNNLALSYKDVGLIERALPLLEQTVNLSTSALGPEHPHTLGFMGNLAAAYQSAGDLPKALLLKEQTLELKKAKLGPQHPETLKSMNNLAVAYGMAGQTEKSLPLYEQTLELRKSRLGPTHPETICSINNLALAYDEAGDMEKALPLYEQSLELHRKTWGEQHLKTLQCMHNLGVAYRELSQVLKALPLLEQVLELRQSKLGADHPDTLTSMNSLAVAYATAGQNDKALPLYEQTLELRKIRLGPDHPETLNSMNNLAKAYIGAGQNEKALLLFEQTLELMNTTIGPEHTHTLNAMNNLALTYRDIGNHSRAWELAQAALETQRLRSPGAPADRQRRAVVLLIAAASLNQMAQPEKAETLAREAVAIRQEITPNEWGYFNAVSYLGECLLGQQKLTEAEDLLQRGYAGLREREAILRGTPNEKQLKLAVGRLRKLYSALNRPDEIAKWQAELERLESPGDESQAPTPR